MENETHTILVVDDQEWNRDLLCRRFQRRGFQVLQAHDGHSALEVVRTQDVHLVLLDIMMPGLSGIDVLRSLRRTHTPTELPIVMTTAKDESEDIVEALELGANDYVTKPLDFAVVFARVNVHLRTRAASMPTTPPKPAAETPSPTIPAAQETGTVVADRYRLETRLGSGNFGSVYRATHLGLKRPVAIKLLQTTIETTAVSLARFQQEGISACRLQHPNAVSVLDFGVTNEGLAFLVMELLNGRTVSEELVRNGRFSQERAAEILFPVCEVLTEAHGVGLVHRDIKPANIFLHRGLHGEMVKVLDFGIAKVAGEAVTSQSLTVEGSVLGSPAYMAPERLRNQPYDGRSDVYSVGVTMFEMLTGRAPFIAAKGDPIGVAMMHLTEPPPPPRQLVPDLPLALEAVILQALIKDPRERPKISELTRNLARALGHAEPARASTVRRPIPANPRSGIGPGGSIRRSTQKATEVLHAYSGQELGGHELNPLELSPDEFDPDEFDPQE